MRTLDGVVKQLFVCGLAALLFAGAATAADWFIGPSGTADGAGTKVSPWGFVDTMAAAHPEVRPGDTVWVLPGDYVIPAGAQPMKLKGTAGQPIIVRAFQDGRASISGQFKMDRSSEYVWIWDLEFHSGYVAFNPMGTGHKLINSILRDNGGGANFAGEIGPRSPRVRGLRLPDLRRRRSGRPRLQQGWEPSAPVCRHHDPGHY